MTSILLTGATGYIGSHTCIQVIGAGWRPVIVDNLCNSSAVVVERIERITGTRPDFVQADLRDRAALHTVFQRFGIDAVVHFAGLKAVGESVIEPLRYYDNNLVGTLVLLDLMRAHGVSHLVFSSSATVYGTTPTMPLIETAPVDPVNPYGRTKLMIEQIIRDVVSADPGFRALLLRYFNPVGAHPSGLIGEDPAGIPNNLMPFIAQVAVGRRPKLSVFGGDYDTQDGTGVRDYIHVEDLAAGHVAALRYLLSGQSEGACTVNLGTGHGHSVLEVIRAFESASGREIPYEVVARRPGDVAVCYADVCRAREVLGWRATRGLTEMCADAWRWQSQNPTGFR